ncbi:uncharacterized protein LOC136091506 isoform X2 [Hydra vulgaris]|uniref:Uncharacterized protein LOC136091506 isoform X2 n=1 Tax=Hydra vulgaris TaxID=6087 RepID=A0ABM4DL00_HYDVU
MCFNSVLLFASSLVFFSWKVNHFSYIDVEPKVNFLLAVTLIPWFHGAVICLVKIMGFNINIICNYTVASAMHALTSLVIFMASSILTQAIVEKEICMDDCLQTMFCVIMGYIDSFGLLLLSYFCFKQKLNESINEECYGEAIILDETTHQMNLNNVATSVYSKNYALLTSNCFLVFFANLKNEKRLIFNYNIKLNFLIYNNENLESLLITIF